MLSVSLAVPPVADPNRNETTKMVLMPSFLVLLAFFAVGDAVRDAKIEEFPFQVSIKTPDDRHLCGGIIITEKWVLTAKSCVSSHGKVRVSYGVADTNEAKNVVDSERIEQESGFPLNKGNRLALILLSRPIQISKSAKPAGLPTTLVVLQNTTKVSGWKLTPGVDVPPSLYAGDVYYVIPKDCRTPSGSPLHLDSDEFCGVEDESSVSTFGPGTIVSKAAVALGIVSETPLSMYQPYVYVKLSEHENWIRGILKDDAQDVKWVDEMPKDSAPLHGGLGLALVGISAIFVRFI